MNLLHALLSWLPFEWAQFAFMRHALIAVLIIFVVLSGYSDIV